MFTRKSTHRNCSKARNLRRHGAGQWLATCSVMIAPEDLFEEDTEVQAIIEALSERINKEEIEHE